jgi:tRNA(Ile)-lysidine synthase
VASAPLRPRDVPGPGRYAVAELGCVIEVRAARAADVPWPLVVRSRRPGDRFRPDGGRGTKTLKRWLIDRKVPRERRDAVVVLAAGTRVLAVPELEAVAAGEDAAGAGLVVRLRPVR